MIRTGSVFFLSMSLLSCAAVAERPEGANLTIAPLAEVLTQQLRCSPRLLIRSQQPLREAQQICQDLLAQEQHFFQIFPVTQPVINDHNVQLVANIYQDVAAYQQYAGAHFGIDTDNGGMYLEGLPEKPDNQANFIAYQRDGKIWNLRHEYVHYLDARYNLYGDFCKSLHDNHSGPEFCPQPSPLKPHLVWWSEGIAEYLAQGQTNAKAIALGQSQQYRLSELFNTSYEQEGGTERVYRWGYLAARYMVEQQPEKLQQMLMLTRAGHYPRYQALLLSWGQSMDSDFARWLTQLALNEATAHAAVLSK